MQKLLVKLQDGGNGLPLLLTDPRPVREFGLRLLGS